MRIVLATLLSAVALMAADENSNRRAPGWALVDPRGEFHDLADYRGKILVLDFMKTTCPHCATFTEILGQVQQKYGDKVAILSVVNTQDDNPNSVAQYVSGHKITYPIVFDMGQMTYSYVRKPTADLPHVFLIDATGFIRHDYVYGPFTRDVFEGKGLFAALDGMLKK